MNGNYKAITEAGYTLEATTTKYGEGYMHLLQDGERVIRIHIMTNNRTGKVIMASLPKAMPGSHVDCAMNDLREVALNRVRRAQRQAVNAYLDEHIGQSFAVESCKSFWLMSARSIMFRLASQYSNTYDITKKIRQKTHLNNFHEFVYEYLAGEQTEFPQNTFEGFASIITQHLN